MTAHLYLPPKWDNNLLTHWGCHHAVFCSGWVGRGVPHWDPCYSATASSLLAKATGGGGGIPAPKEALPGLHLGTLPMHKVKIKAWSQTMTC